jgi:hypothetical protein
MNRPGPASAIEPEPGMEDSGRWLQVSDGSATVLYRDVETRAEAARTEGKALRLTLHELTATTGWELEQ